MTTHGSCESPTTRFKVNHSSTFLAHLLDFFSLEMTLNICLAVTTSIPTHCMSQFDRKIAQFNIHGHSQLKSYNIIIIASRGSVYERNSSSVTLQSHSARCNAMQCNTDPRPWTLDLGPWTMTHSQMIHSSPTWPTLLGQETWPHSTCKELDRTRHRTPDQQLTWWTAGTWTLAHRKRNEACLSLNCKHLSMPWSHLH